MKTRASILACGAAISLTGAASADPTVLYSNDFETGTPGPEWTGHNEAPRLDQAAAFTRFLGRYAGGNGVTLTLPTPPRTRDEVIGGGASDGFTLTFDLYAIDSWDGSADDYGPDRFQVLVNGAVAFDETIANQHTLQTYREPDVGRAPLGFRADVNDSIYRSITIDFDPGASPTIALRFQGVGLQTLTDESWGIDNIEVTHQSVPSAGPVSLLALAGLIAVRRKRG